MNKALKFEKIKKILSSIALKKIDNSQKEDKLFIDRSSNLDEKFIRQLDLINNVISLLETASTQNDELATQAALSYLRTHAMSFSDFFYVIVDDIDTLLDKSSWAEFPENYKIPDHYNFREE
ncbi:hypothetical protein ACL2XP_06295 [Sodalis sp. RH21]|uniref:hypothetical protein n=1 Tax=unclassified Sodalis (in: enterobacteria) TaxID=2636512 RepID=UPI0039B52913